MASQWTPTHVYTAGSTITGTNANITDVTCYADNGYWADDPQTGVKHCFCGTGYNYRNSPTVVRFKIHPTKKLESISIPLTQQKYSSALDVYNQSKVKFYAKYSTSGTDYPTTDVTSSTQYNITAAGTKNLVVSFSSPVSSDFYVYLWGARVNSSDLGNYFIDITAIGAPVGTAATYTVTLSPVSGVTYNKTSPQTVSAGSAFSFTVTIGSTYMTNSSFAVKAGTTTLTPSSQSGKTYTYSVAINANTTITVTGVVLGGVVRIGSGSAWVNYQVYIGNGSQWVQYLPYIGTGSSWQLYS